MTIDNILKDFFTGSNKYRPDFWTNPISNTWSANQFKKIILLTFLWWLLEGGAYWIHKVVIWIHYFIINDNIWHVRYICFSSFLRVVHGQIDSLVAFGAGRDGSSVEVKTLTTLQSHLIVVSILLLQFTIIQYFELFTHTLYLRYRV